MKTALIVSVALLTSAGCADRETRAKSADLEVPNKAIQDLTARIEKLEGAQTKTDAQVALANSSAEKRNLSLERQVEAVQKYAEKRMDSHVEYLEKRIDTNDKFVFQQLSSQREHAEKLLDIRATGLEKQRDSDVANLQKLIHSNRAQVSQLATELVTPDAPAVLDFFNPDLTTLRTIDGFRFYVRPSKIEPVGGATVTLRFQIGNPYAAEFDAISIHITYGAAEPKRTALTLLGSEKPDRDAFLAANEKENKAESVWRKSLKSFSTKSREKLPPGSWTDVGIQIPGVNVAELRYVEIRLSPSSVSLSQKR